MAGYSTSPQAKKLGLPQATTTLVHRRPPEWRFEDDSAGSAARDIAELRENGTVRADLLLAFCREPSDYLADLDALAAIVFPSGALWVLWPRKAAGHRSAMTESLIREAALERGLVDVKVAAVDTDWSGLKLVWRTERRNREARPQ